jgi:hypothetical protein
MMTDALNERGGGALFWREEHPHKSATVDSGQRLLIINRNVEKNLKMVTISARPFGENSHWQFLS